MEEYKKETASAYQADGEKYTKKFLQDARDYHAEDLLLFTQQLSGKKILDVGCGPGGDLEWFRENGFDALGIDLTDTFIEECVKKGLNVRKMDIENPLLWPNSFDGIWASYSLLHIPKGHFAKTMSGLLRLLKPNGVFWLAVIEGAGESFSVEDSNLAHKRWFTYFMSEELEKLLGPYDIIYKKRDDSRSDFVRLKYLFRLKK